MGYALLLGSLALDGITGPFQEKLVHTHKPTSYHMMMYSNIWGAFFLGIGAPKKRAAPRFCLTVLFLSCSWVSIWRDDSCAQVLFEPPPCVLGYSRARNHLRFGSKFYLLLHFRVRLPQL